MVFPVFLILLLFSNYSLLNAESNVNYETRSLYGEREPKRGKTIILEAPDEGNYRKKRSAPSPNSNSTSNLNYTKINHLHDGHKQLMVHWVGEGSNVIICLAKDPPPIQPNVSLNPSAVYISYDYGDSYKNKTDYFKLENGNYSTVEKFFNHPKYDTHFIFNDVQNKLLFITSDYGRNISRITLNFTPSEVSFHEYQPQTFLVLDKSDFKNKLWITEDSGQSWTVLQEYVKAFFWMQDEKSQQQLIIQRQEPSNLTTTFYSSKLYKDRFFNIYATEIKDFFIKGDYIFYSMKNKKESYDLYVSYKLGKRLQCIFDTELDLKGYNIADVTGNRALIAVSHTNTLSHLYVSENLKGSDGKVRFTLSLDSVLSYFPNSSWKDSWLHHMSEDAFADVYKVEGVSGIYIASQVILKPTGNNLGPQHLVTRITFDHGGSWNPLSPPEKDTEGQQVVCSLTHNCSLHLSQRFSQLYPETRSISILSSKSAPGIIIATGVIGKSLKGHFGVYISTDAGITWRQSLRDLYFFNMGDHGGILTAVKYLKMRGELRQVLFSTDEGESWTSTDFHNEDIRLYGLMTEPGENTTIFTMFGSLPQQHQWIIVKLDLRPFFKYNCTEDDYKVWSPSRRSEHKNHVPCVLGQQRTYKRRISHSNCYNGENFDLPITMETCECDRLDYECDFNFIKSHNPMQCIRNRSIEVDPYQVPANCKVGQSYNRTKGYRKIAGDLCYDGLEKQFLPDIIPCPTKRIPNMLLYAQRERIVRMKLPEGTQETLQIPKLKNVIAVDFDLKNNCVYWADIVSDTIGRLCENGISPPEILVSSDLVSVEGMALDWVSNNLYFVDGLRAKIELIRTNITHQGRMRRTILESPKLSKPRGIAVHPKHGYLFWTDWASSNPSVNRANLDGSNIIQIANKSVVEWPNGITIDDIAERVYWVDAREDYIGSTNLDGTGFKKIQIANEYVSHPFAVAVFKDDLFWDDWKRNSIFMSNKDHGGPVGTLIRNVSGLMDLKVIAHGVQEGTNPCSNSTLCPYICVGAPDGKRYKCLCPDGMEEKDDKCVCPGGASPNLNHTCPKMTGTCSSEHFECGNGVCVPKSWKCDDEDDCGDNSDEITCGSETCPPNYFVCGDGKCLPHYWRCDYESDCVDGSDEKDCPKENCTGTFFACDNGRCISSRWKCDGEDDCKDFSDERDCAKLEPTTCKTDEFKCSGGSTTCIPATWRCDGESDCRDKSDEVGCKNNTCLDFQFSCGGSFNKCIYKSWVCDGDKDCMDGSDEQNCTDTATPINVPFKTPTFKPMNGSPICQDWMFTCANNRCIPIWWKCDGANDCEDESDEQGCGFVTTTQSTNTVSEPNFHVCAHNQFQCASGECIVMSWVCDKAKDCINGEDEDHCEGVMSCDQKDQFKCKIDGSCISYTNVCNGHPDCPDSSDEEYCISHNLPGPATPSCSMGYFPCDITKCYPLAEMCDGTKNCLDGTDEMNCTSVERVYQVLQMGVDERTINDSSLLLYWWIPIPDKVKLEFMPSITSVNDGKWSNKTWTEHSDYRFDGLKPFTRYNMTVYVRINGSNKVFPPAKYFQSTTDEGIPSPPHNLTVQQKNGTTVLVSWNKPTQPNGTIQNYEICWSPPPIKMRLSDSSTAHLLAADFEPNVKYSFYVIAYNNKHHSERSEVKVITFGDHTELERITSLNLVNSSDHSISLSWNYTKPADLFVITADAGINYPKLPSYSTKTTNITINNLPSGSHLTFKIAALRSGMRGPDTTIATRTSGVVLPELHIQEVKVVQNSGTSVKLTWLRPKDNRKVGWIYGVYYGVTEEETLEKPRFNTTDLSYIITNLYACEKYIVTVGIIGPLGIGPVSSMPRSVTTFLNDRAPPKRVNVQAQPNNHLQMLVQWSPSCSNMKSPMNYIISIHEKNRNINNRVITRNSNSQELSQVFNVNFGGIYEVKVRTNVEGALFSPIVTYTAPPIMPPYEVSVSREANGSYFLYWQERTSDAAMGKFHYEVLVSEGSELNESTAQKFDVLKPPFIFNNNTADMYSFAVRLKTDDGFRSILSEMTSSANERVMQMTNTNLSVLIPVCLLLGLLGGALAFYVVKYRKLQNSFTRFANSHYDTRSEAATFDDNVFEEDDNPQIRGFSDDEPLVIA